MDKTKTYKTIADLIMEPSFLAWHLKKNALYEQAWNKWIASNPLRAQLAEEAAEVLAVLVNPEIEPVSNCQCQASFNKLLQKITEREKILNTVTS